MQVAPPNTPTGHSCVFELNVHCRHVTVFFIQFEAGFVIPIFVISPPALVVEASVIESSVIGALVIEESSVIESLVIEESSVIYRGT